MFTAPQDLVKNECAGAFDVVGVADREIELQERATNDSAQAMSSLRRCPLFLALERCGDPVGCDAHHRIHFRQWRKEQLAAGTCDAIMARIFSGWDNTAEGCAGQWTERDEAQINRWLNEPSSRGSE